MTDKELEKLVKSLTYRQKAFCQEYIVDYNGTAAAIRAGYAVKYADRQASQTLDNPKVVAYIDHLSRSKEAKLTSVSPEYVIQKVTEIVTKAGVRDGDALRGLELLARHLGMFIDRTEITGKDGGAIELEQRKVAQEAAEFTSKIKALRDKAVAQSLEDEEKKVVAIR